jgi:hypothetical protein
MLSYALKFKQGIEAFISKLAKKRYSDEIRTCLKYRGLFGELKLTTQEWDCIKITCGVLSFFNEITLSFSTKTSNTEEVLATYYVITDFFDTILDGTTEAKEGLYEDLGIMNILQGQSGFPKDLIRGLEKAREKHRKYYDLLDGTDFSYIGCLLDPRLKRRFIEQHLTTLDAENITKECTRTFCEYDSVLGRVSELTKERTEPIAAAGRRGYVPHQLRRQMEQASRSSPMNSVEREMGQFQKLSSLSFDENLNVLEYWRQNRFLYPRLSRLAF